MDNEKLNELLLTVQKPGRYVGGEWNAARKEWTDGRVKVCLAFPDVYEVGMSYLGTKILYGILNGRSDCLCERVFAPWTDFEAVLRNNNIPLYSLESRRPLREFDIVGFSLAYELTYTNILNMLDLGGIPLRSAGRSDEDPLIIAGGPSAFNPEPMAEFIDAFVIGDGEDVINEIADLYKKSRAAGRGPRAALLRELAKIKGVYVPSLYTVEYNTDGTMKSFAPVAGGIPARIEKRTVADLDMAFYPVEQIVPNIGVVHDRLAIEIMRGCKYACRFCQAAATYRPWRERSIDSILRIARDGYAATGYDEISLLSLSSADYTRLKELVEKLNSEFCAKAVSISVPSLRIEDAIGGLPELLSKVKKPGLTFAPEAGSDALRRSVNKNIRIDKLYETAAAAFRSGWKRVKLYFMMGLPGEKDEDLAAITEIANRASSLKREIDGRPAQVAVSVNAFIPKPHTYLQYEPMDSMDSLSRRRDILKSGCRSKAIELEFHSLEMSYIEAAVSRGDRRMSGVILNAWKAGARFDGWREGFGFQKWMDAFTGAKIDHSFYVTRPMSRDDLLPWGFICTGTAGDKTGTDLSNGNTATVI